MTNFKQTREKKKKKKKKKVIFYLYLRENNSIQSFQKINLKFDLISVLRNYVKTIVRIYGL